MAAQASLPPPSVALVAIDPHDSARAAGLRYIADDRPGIVRKRVGKGFAYVGPDGRPMRDAARLKQIRALAIPPAWEHVWISPLPNGHIQATGRDARGRKQYRYHPRWRETRDETKYHRMLAFAEALPRIRTRVSADLGRPGLPREKVIATIVRLLETTLIRVGNEEYARTNHSFGLTTLRDRHVRITGTTIAFRFRGKSGVHRELDVRDRRLASIVRKMAVLPGHELFQYLDENGEPHTIESGDVNEYLGQISGEPFTAKDFRTWGGTVLAAVALHEIERSLATMEQETLGRGRRGTKSGAKTGAKTAMKIGAKTGAKKRLLAAVKSVAQKLGNTPSVCRKCYVHPAVLDGYLEGQRIELATPPGANDGDPAGLRTEEAAVVAFLKGRVAR
jgi:DNA topoisomerase-1